MGIINGVVESVYHGGRKAQTCGKCHNDKFKTQEPIQVGDTLVIKGICTSCGMQNILAKLSVEVSK